MQDNFEVLRPWIDRKTDKAVSFAPETATSVPVPTTIRPIILWGFYAFIFSIPFETADIGIGQGYLSLSKIIGALFLLLTLLQPRLCYKRPPAAFWYFAAYLWIYMGLGVLQDAQYYSAIAVRFSQLVQLMILLWVAYSLLQYDYVCKQMLIAFVAACLTLAVLQILGITTTMWNAGVMATLPRAERVTALSEDPNIFADVMTLGVLALIGLTYGPGKIQISRILAWPMLGLLAITMTRAGSRGAVVALGVGILAFALQGRGLRAKVSNVLLIMLGASALAWLSYSSEVDRARWELTFEKGSLATREKIYPQAWEMIVEQPLIGWGPVRHYYELGTRMHKLSKDTHNLFLWVLTETGLMGTIPFCIGLWLCVRAAWKARMGTQGILPMALMLALLVINMSLTFYNRKLHWLILAYALASAKSAMDQMPRNRVIWVDPPAVLSDREHQGAEEQP
jgi:hypothetical protein